MGLSTHVLDLAHGRPAAGVAVAVVGPDGARRESTTNADGRLSAPLYRDEEFAAGPYRLTFSVAAYFRAQGLTLPDPPFLDEVDIAFGVSDPSAHYHVPLLVSPYGYSTYRGS